MKMNVTSTDYDNFSYSSRFHANNITGSGVMPISFHIELTRNPEIENTRLSFAEYLETGTS